MIKNTPIKTILDRAFTGLETMLGVTRQEQEVKAEKAKAKKEKKLKDKLADDEGYPI
jgi:hypothetical protein